ncbi:hypothetical protein RhiirB3_424566 [Rhizophagus irregularis]|nr:hypothetical protein RhiirB3_424566 [Rhizophagus irregularis]
MKHHRVSQNSQELLILSQDISKAFDSIDLSMFRLCFDWLKFPSNLSEFIISLFTSRKNRILTPFGKTESYDLLIGIDQGEVISLLLWTIYFDPLLTELSSSVISPYIWSSGIPANILNINNNDDVAVPITQLTYMDDSTLIAFSLTGLEQLLSIARDFYFLNNITANFSKYELVVSSSAGNNLISFHLDSEILDHLSPMSFSLQALRLSSSFRFLDVWFNLQSSPNFVLSQLKDIYSSFVASVHFKKLTPAQLAYLHSLIVLPKIQFRSQVLYLSESQIMRIANGYYGLQRKALSVARTFPSIALTSRFFSKDANPYDSLCERLLNRFLSWISLLFTGSKQANWILIILRTLQLILNHNWLFQAIKLLYESGLQFDFPDNTFLNLMPNEVCPLVSLSSDLAVLETRSWLKSTLWCFSQIVDPFYNFQFIWSDLKYMVDSSNSLIFGQVFYTFDDDSETRIVYFSHWIPFTHNQMQITPCPGCPLHCLDMDEDPLALKTVGGKLIHCSCLSILPSYHCLQLFQMTVHVDISQQFINLKLSPFILCSYFRFLLGFTELYIPERYLAIAPPPLIHCDNSPALLPNLAPVSNPKFALRSDSIFHISGTIHAIDSLTSLLVCAWIQSLEGFILDSRIFSCPMISPYNDVAELAFILYVLNSLPLDSSVSFVSMFKFDMLFSRCFLKDSIPALSVRTHDLIKGPTWPDLLQPIPLLDDIFPFSLNTMGLFTRYDKLLTQDLFDELPVMYRLFQRFSGLYADDSLCPICGIFMETLEHLFTCSPSYLDDEKDYPALLNHKDVTTVLIERFLVKLATKVSFSLRCKQLYDELLTALRNLLTLGLSDLLSSNNYSSFSASWFFQEIYHGLWRPKCKIKVTKNAVKGTLPGTLRSYKGPSVQPFRFSASQVALS